MPTNDRRTVKETNFKEGSSKAALQLDPRVFSPSSSFSQKSNNFGSSPSKHMKVRVEENEKEAESTQKDNTSMDSSSQQVRS